MTPHPEVAAVLAEMRITAGAWRDIEKGEPDGELSPQYCKAHGDCAHELEVLIRRIESALASSAEPVAVVCLMDEPYSHGHMVEAQLQIRPGTELPIGTKLYAHAPAVPVESRYECRECDSCGHAGINDTSPTTGACFSCDWSGPEPIEDKCPGCNDEGCMTAACPKCGSRYRLVAELETTPPPASVPDGYALVPSKMYVSPEQWDAAQFAFGGPGTVEEEGFYDCTLWVGEIENDDGSKTHGLHVSCDECPEDGSITLSEFDAPPTNQEGAAP